VPDLPGAVVGLLDGADLDARVGLAIELITVDVDGWPRVALVSAGEVLAMGPATVALALWPGSRTTANLERAGRALLAFVDGGAAWRIALDARRVADVEAPERRAVFAARVADVRRDEVANARLTSGITFELPDRSEVLGRWRSTLTAIREALPRGAAA
jgi:hypothetical protein